MIAPWPLHKDMITDKELQYSLLIMLRKITLKCQDKSYSLKQWLQKPWNLIGIITKCYQDHRTEKSQHKKCCIFIVFFRVARLFGYLN